MFVRASLARIAAKLGMQVPPVLEPHSEAHNPMGKDETTHHIAQANEPYLRGGAHMSGKSPRQGHCQPSPGPGTGLVKIQVLYAGDGGQHSGSIRHGVMYPRPLQQPKRGATGSPKKP